MNDMKQVLVLIVMLSVPLSGLAQFVARSGIFSGGGGTKVYGDNIQSAPVSS